MKTKITYYYCDYENILLRFDTEQEARDKAKELTIKGIHGTVRKRCDIREDGFDMGNGWRSAMGGTGEIIYERIIDIF